MKYCRILDIKVRLLKWPSYGRLWRPVSNGMDLRRKKIFLTGVDEFLGQPVYRKLLERGALKENILIQHYKDYDLREMARCKKLVKGREIIIHLAGRVGGIGFNREHPGQAFYDNAAMAINLLEACRLEGVEKFVGIGTVCSYPKFTPTPFKEDDLWNGYPEETNASYGLAKKMMLAQSQAYRQEYGLNAVHLLMVNLYGPGDDFNPKSSHVIAALILKIAEAKEQNFPFIEARGTGKASREFLYVEDAAEGVVLAAEKYDKPEPVNMGAGREITIKDLTETLCRLMEYKGEIRWDASRPDGQPRRVLDVSRAEKEFGFKAKTDFDTGLKKTIEWFYKR